MVLQLPLPDRDSSAGLATLTIVITYGGWPALATARPTSSLGSCRGKLSPVAPSRVRRVQSLKLRCSVQAALATPARATLTAAWRRARQSSVPRCSDPALLASPHRSCLGPPHTSCPSHPCKFLQPSTAVLQGHAVGVNTLQVATGMGTNHYIADAPSIQVTRQ